jgi:two-component system sensor histidine kinase KdpD
MQPKTIKTEIMQWLWATAATIAATFVLVETGVNAPTAGLVFLTLVVWFASQMGYRLSLYMALLCAAGFDYFFLPPYRTLEIIGVQQWVALFSFMASSVVVSRVAEQARNQAYQAELRRREVERLYELGQEMMLHEDADGLMRELPRVIARIFSLEGVVLYVRARDRFQSASSDLPMSIENSLKAMAQGPTMMTDIPGEYAAITLMLGLEPIGALGWKPASLSHELATAIAAQTAIAVARAMTIEASTKLEAARESERLRTALTDSLTHELRTPLTSIRAAASTLHTSQNLDHESRTDLAAIIDEEAARLDQLIGEAVEMAEIDAHAVTVHCAPQSPQAFLEQAVESVSRLLAEDMVSVVVEESIATATVWLDEHLIGRVLHHLLENVASHTPAGTHVTVRCAQVEDRLQFTVEDDGPGIDAKDLPLIFEKFYRGQKKHSRKGSGMGLAIVRAILLVHQGGIEVTSEAGHGASFRFWVPLRTGKLAAKA